MNAQKWRHLVSKHFGLNADYRELLCDGRQVAPLYMVINICKSLINGGALSSYQSNMHDKMLRIFDSGVYAY